MKFTYILLVLFGIQFIMGMMGLMDLPGDGIYNLIVNPTNLFQNGLFSLFNDLTLTVGALGIFIGVLFKNDFIVFASIASVFISSVSWMVNFFNFVSGQLGAPIATLCVAPLIFLMIMAVLDWWRKGE